MPELVERIDVEAPPELVWEVLTDWVGQGEWMVATDVETVGGPAQGVGGRLAAAGPRRDPAPRRPRPLTGGAARRPAGDG